MKDHLEAPERLPAHWTKAALGDVATVINGGTPDSKLAEFWDGAVQWLTPKDMGKMEGREIAKTPRTISEVGLAKSSARLVPPGSVILSTRAPIGHLAINTAAMAFNQGCRGIIPGKRLDHVFLYYFLEANRQKLDDLGSGTTFKELSGTNLKGFKIPLPPLEEQKRIVAVLDQAFTALSRARTHAEANLADAQLLFEHEAAEVFQSLERKHPARRTVADVAASARGSIRTGPFGSQLLHSEFVDNGIAVLGIDNAVANEFRWAKRRYITEEKYRQLSRYTVQPGDVVITIMGTCGRCAVIPDDIPLAINTKHLCCITLDRAKCLPDYMHRYFLLSPTAREYLSAQASGSIMDGLNMGIIKEMPISAPPLTAQVEVVGKIAEIEDGTRSIARSYKEKIADLDTLRQSFLQKAFAGELTEDIRV